MSMTERGEEHVRTAVSLHRSAIILCHGRVCGQRADPLEADLVVADAQRSENTICYL